MGTRRCPSMLRMSVPAQITLTVDILAPTAISMPAIFRRTCCGQFSRISSVAIHDSQPHRRGDARDDLKRRRRARDDHGQNHPGRSPKSYYKRNDEARDRRWSWLGHVLRMPEHRLVRQVLLNCVRPTHETLFADVPNLSIEKATKNV